MDRFTYKQIVPILKQLVRSDMHILLPISLIRGSVHVYSSSNLCVTKLPSKNSTCSRINMICLYLLPCRHQAILSVVVDQSYRLRPGDSQVYRFIGPPASTRLCTHHAIPVLGGQGTGLVCSEAGVWSPFSKKGYDLGTVCHSNGIAFCLQN